MFLNLKLSLVSSLLTAYVVLLTIFNAKLAQSSCANVKRTGNPGIQNITFDTIEEDLFHGLNSYTITSRATVNDNGNNYVESSLSNTADYTYSLSFNVTNATDNRMCYTLSNTFKSIPGMNVSTMMLAQSYDDYKETVCSTGMSNGVEGESRYKTKKLKDFYVFRSIDSVADKGIFWIGGPNCYNNTITYDSKTKKCKNTPQIDCNLADGSIVNFQIKDGNFVATN
eukprot:Pgem_evm1s5420